MSNLVARFAENIYWLGRYLERAENLARILEINETYARDPASGPSWKKMLELNVDDARFESLHGTTTADSVIFFYLIDRDNPNSIRNCTRLARENARSVRHLISTEMWTQLNVFYTKLARLRAPDATVKGVNAAARRVIAGCQSFEGIAEGTFLRGEPWCFYQLGKYIERADQTTRILDMGYDRLTPSGDDAVAWVHWNVLLRTVSGYHAYRSRHPGISSPHEIASFLLYDDEFPRAVALCVQRLTERLRDLERRHRNRSVFNLEVDRRNLEFLIETGPGKGLTPSELHNYLDNVQAAIAGLSNSISQRYFWVRDGE